MSEAIFTRCVNPPNVMPIERGGTGGNTKKNARTNLEVEKITNLYSNGSGTNGTITLSQAFTNFTAIRVYYRVGEGERKSETFYNLGVTSPSVQLNHYNTNGTNIYMRAVPVTFSNKTVTWGQNAWFWRENGTWGGSNNAGQIKVYRIDGYSY
jgi:hypothetical protein